MYQCHYSVEQTQTNRENNFNGIACVTSGNSTPSRAPHYLTQCVFGQLLAVYADDFSIKKFSIVEISCVA
jgi:hypothetical protein